jgi:hypothetical protein
MQKDNPPYSLVHGVKMPHLEFSVEDGELIMGPAEATRDVAPVETGPVVSRTPFAEFSCYDCTKAYTGNDAVLLYPMMRAIAEKVPDIYMHDGEVSVCSSCWESWDAQDTNEDNHGLCQVGFHRVD